MTAKLVVQVTHCGRCRGDHEMAFSAFSLHPITDTDGTVWSHWGLCPVTHEPVFLLGDAARAELEEQAGSPQDRPGSYGALVAQPIPSWQSGLTTCEACGARWQATSEYDQALAECPDCRH